MSPRQRVTLQIFLAAPSSFRAKRQRVSISKVKDKFCRVYSTNICQASIFIYIKKNQKLYQKIFSEVLNNQGF